MKFNQSKSMERHYEVIQWFRNIGNEQKHKFILCDIKEFYPIIMKVLLRKCLKTAKGKVKISDDDKKKKENYARKSFPV